MAKDRVVEVMKERRAWCKGDVCKHLILVVTDAIVCVQAVMG